MKICDLNSGVGQLTLAFSELKERWAETKTQWTDDTMRQFEKKHLQEIPSRVQLLLAAAQRLGEVLQAAERDLNDDASE
jgi:hypothetical protein